MPKIAKAMVIRVILVVVSLIWITRADERSNEVEAAEVRTLYQNFKSLIPAQVLITPSSLVSSTGDDATTVDVVDSHDNDGCGGEFTPNTELRLVRLPPPPLEQPRVDQTTVVAANSLNDHTIIQGGDHHVPAQSSGRRIVTGTSRTTTTATSTGDDVVIDVVDSDYDNDFAGGFTYTSELSVVPLPLQLLRVDQDTVAANSRNDNNFPAEYRDHVPAEQSSGQMMVTGTTSSNSTANGSLNTERPTEGREDEDSFTSGKTLLALCFESAVALMVNRFQTQGNSSPSLSSSASPPPHSSSSLAAWSSFPLAMVWATNEFGFTATFMGMILRKAHPTAANICNYAGIFSVALGFYSIMGMLVPDGFTWTAWAAVGILLLALVYSIARR